MNNWVACWNVNSKSELSAMEEPERPFVIATYNVHKCRGLDRRVRPDASRRSCAKSKCRHHRVAGGLERRRRSERERDQARFIAEELGLIISIGENRRLARRGLRQCHPEPLSITCRA